MFIFEVFIKNWLEKKLSLSVFLKVNFYCLKKYSFFNFNILKYFYMELDSVFHFISSKCLIWASLWLHFENERVFYSYDRTQLHWNNENDIKNLFLLRYE